ncbi:MAG: DUF6152 family protein [Steroidobacteraceae bacterium]
MCAASAGYAHHSYAMYDAEKTVEYTGTVSSVRWANPHVWIELAVPSPDGSADKVLNIEGHSPAGMRSLGWEKDTVVAGDVVTVSIHPLRSGQFVGALVKAIKDGVPIEAQRKNQKQEGAGK